MRDRDTWLSFESERDDETARLSAWIESYTDSELFSTGGEGGRGISRRPGYLVIGWLSYLRGKPRAIARAGLMVRAVADAFVL